METLKKTALILIAAFLMSCEKDDDLKKPQYEQEIITTVEMIFSSQDGLDDKFLIHRKLRGKETKIILPSLFAGTTYNVKIHFLDENLVPVGNINPRIIGQGDEYQVFIDFTPLIGISQSYTDSDKRGNPIGLGFQIITDSVGVTNMNLQLRSKPDKAAMGVTDGNSANAGGAILKEIDLELSIE